MDINGNVTDDTTLLKTNLARQFKMKDLGYFQYFWNVEVASSCKGYFLS